MGQASKYYTVFLSQEGTAAPTTRDLDSTLGRVIWARTGTGTYTATCVGAFREYKTTPLRDVGYDISGNKITAERTSWDVITVKTYAAEDTETLADDVLSDQFFHIEVYL